MTIAQTAHPTPEASRELYARGMLLFNRERERIHRLYGETWAVPSSQGGYWRVNLSDGTCGCQDFRYQCTDEAGQPIMACKHVAAATIARAKREQESCLCYDGWHFLGHEVETPDGDEEVIYERIPCRRCR